jgi:hypothetical protein
MVRWDRPTGWTQDVKGWEQLISITASWWPQQHKINSVLTKGKGGRNLWNASSVKSCRKVPQCCLDRPIQEFPGNVTAESSSAYSLFNINLPNTLHLTKILFSEILTLYSPSEINLHFGITLKMDATCILLSCLAHISTLKIWATLSSNADKLSAGYTALYPRR